MQIVLITQKKSEAARLRTFLAIAAKLFLVFAHITVLVYPFVYKVGC